MCCKKTILQTKKAADQVCGFGEVGCRGALSSQERYPNRENFNGFGSEEFMRYGLLLEPQPGDLQPSLYVAGGWIPEGNADSVVRSTFQTLAPIWRA